MINNYKSQLHKNILAYNLYVHLKECKTEGEMCDTIHKILDSFEETDQSVIVGQAIDAINQFSDNLCEKFKGSKELYLIDSGPQAGRDICEVVKESAEKEKKLWLRLR